MKIWRKTMAFLAVAVFASAAMADDNTELNIETFSVDTSANRSTICFPAEEGTTYVLQRTSDLSSVADWFTVDLHQCNTEGTMELTDGVPNGWPRAFYRIIPLSFSPDDPAPDAAQIAQAGVAAASQDYQDAIESLASQSSTKYDMFLSGDLSVQDRYHYSGFFYDNATLWNGEAFDWLPGSVLQNTEINLRDIRDMEWIWVREQPRVRSRILGRYSYVCFNLSGGVDANLLGRDFGLDLPANGYGTQTNRDNVRKMLLNGVQNTPSTDTSQQLNLARYQESEKTFDTPLSLNKVPDEYFNKDHLSCYSYAVTRRGAGYGEKKPCSFDNIINNPYFSSLVTEMGGNETDVRKALADYFSTSAIPQGIDYPSVKAVPMFNEINVTVQLAQTEESGQWQLKVTVKPEFWCPFPSQDTPSYSYTLIPPTMGGGVDLSGPYDIWVRTKGTTAYGIFDPTITQVDVTPSQLPVEVTTDPKSPGEFVYILNIEGVPVTENGATLDIRQFRIASVSFQKPWALTFNGTPVDSTAEMALAISPNTLSPGTNGYIAGSGYMEVDDPRLNHLSQHWAASSIGSMDNTNTCLSYAKSAAKIKMGYEPGNYMYCRNGKMLSPAELGYIPVYNGSTPWMTLDIFSENGISLMNTLV